MRQSYGSVWLVVDYDGLVLLVDLAGSGRVYYLLGFHELPYFLVCWGWFVSLCWLCRQLLWVEAQVVDVKGECLSDWQLPANYVIAPWPNISVGLWAFMIPTIPVPSTEITKLVPTCTGHMVASFALLNHKLAAGAPLKRIVNFHQPNRLPLTRIGHRMRLAQTNPTVLLHTFGTEQIFVDGHLGKLIPTIWAEFAAFVGQNLYVLLNSLVSLLQVCG